jgi:hypothetical protein
LISVPHKTKYPKIYIDGFRSKWSEPRWDRWHPRLKDPDRMHKAVWLVGLAILSLLELYTNCLTDIFWLSRSSSLVASWKSKTLTDGFSTRQSYKQMKGTLWKNSRIQCYGGNII